MERRKNSEGKIGGKEAEEKLKHREGKTGKERRRGEREKRIE